MWRTWLAVVLGVLWLTSEAAADTVYLKNGEAIWAPEVIEDGNAVVIERLGETLRVARSEVARIEGARMSIPPFYAVPGTEYPAPPVEPERSPSSGSAATAGQNPVQETPPAETFVPPPPPPPSTLSGPWSPRY